MENKLLKTDPVKRLETLLENSTASGYNFEDVVDFIKDAKHNIIKKQCYNEAAILRNVERLISLKKEENLVEGELENYVLITAEVIRCALDRIRNGFIK